MRREKGGWLPEDNVAGAVSFPGLNQCIVARDGLLHDVMPAIEFPDLRSHTKTRKRETCSFINSQQTHQEAKEMAVVFWSILRLIINVLYFYTP